MSNAAHVLEMDAKTYEKHFASARPMTAAEQRSFVLWCKREGFLVVVADLAKAVSIRTLKGGDPAKAALKESELHEYHTTLRKPVNPSR